MRPTILSAAKVDIAAISRWYNQEQPGVGFLFGARIEQTLRLIADQPRLYQLYCDDVRKAPLYPFPYGLYYRDVSDHIQVIAVAHDHQDPSRLAGRLTSTGC